MKAMNRRNRTRRGAPLRPAAAAAVALAALLCNGLQPAHAAELSNTDAYQVRWDNTVKYSLGVRTGTPSDYYLSNPNLNDGDGAFGRGDVISNRLDLLSELDFTLKDRARSGLHVSAAAWYDTVYNRGHDPITANYNALSVPNDQFTKEARRWAGRNAELLDGFVHTSFDLAGHDLSVRLGRHALIWGESLFMAGNGIAAGMAPIDANKALAVPGTLAKEVFMPVNQLSASLRLDQKWSLQGYYQLEFRETRYPPVGTFWSPADLVGPGAETLQLGGGAYFAFDGHRRPDNAKGNYGAAAKFSDLASDIDVGLYYLRYTEHTPQVYTQFTGPSATGQFGTYFFVYPEKIDILGTSLSTKIGDANVAGEISIRRNMPLVSNAQLMDLGLNPSADANRNPLYATGDLVHYQVSTIWVLPRTAAWDGAGITAEIGGHHLYKTTRNEASRDTTKAKTFTGMSLVFDPTWYQVVSDLDLTVPLSVAYNFSTSPIDPTVAPGVGNVGIGVKFTYLRAWRGSLIYTKQLGKDERNGFGDRDNVAFSLAYSF